MSNAFFVKPVQDGCPLTAWWGSYPGHKGLDYGWLIADPARTQQVYAAYAGVVVSIYSGGGYNGGWGNRIIIEHAPGIRTTYNHLKTGSILASVGQSVATRQKIATMGATGKVTGVHLHWELYIDGVRVDPRPFREGKPIPRVVVGSTAESAPSGTQRQVGPTGARRRAQPTTQSESKGGPLAPGVIGNFDGWRRGERVSGNDVWFRGISGDWFWSGAFTDTGTHDLADLNDRTAPASNTRVVGSAPLSRRTGPGTQYAKADGDPLAPGVTGTFTGWAKGELVTIGAVASSIWFQGISGDWFAAAGFTSQSADGLAKVVPPALPSTPAQTEQVDQAFKLFTPDSPLASWYGSPNYNYREPRPADQSPRHITMHWMAGTLAGTDAQFQKYNKLSGGRGDGSAANYGVGQLQIHQYVRERDYQQADGNTESNRWGISIEHEAGPGAPASVAVKELSAKLMADIAKRYGWSKLTVGVNVYPHQHWVATSCPGDLPIQEIVDAANALLKKEEPPVVVPMNPDDQPVTVGWLKQLFEAIVTAVRAFFGSKK